MFHPYEEAQRIDAIINELLTKYPISKADDAQIHAYRTLVIQLESTLNLLRHSVEEAAQYNEKGN